MERYNFRTDALSYSSGIGTERMGAAVLQRCGVVINLRGEIEEEKLRAHIDVKYNIREHWKSKTGQARSLERTGGPRRRGACVIKNPVVVSLSPRFFLCDR